MDAAALRELLDTGHFLSDGGMGTSLIALGAPMDSDLESLSLESPQLVETVHRGFVQAGAGLLLTNTFGANRFRLERNGRSAEVGPVAAAAVGLARKAGAPYVAGSMGPLGVRLAPYGRVQPEQAFDAYRELALALAGAGADMLLIETQTDLREMEQALAAARDAAPELAVAVTATFTRDDRTLLGSSPEQVASRLLELGADAIGANCGEGPAQVLRVIRSMAPLVGDTPLIARPNAGSPSQVAGRLVYPATPAYMAELALRLRDAGASLIGGCCGTTAAHIGAMAEALASERQADTDAGDGWTGQGPGASNILEPSERPGLRLVGTPRTFSAATQSQTPTFREKVERGDFVVTVEMEPPRSFNAAPMVAAAITLRDAGADVIDVADSPMAKMRMSAWAACRLIEEQAGIETVLHFPTRGRNLLRLQGDLLGAHALGIHNLFVCVGDPVTIGDYPHGSDNVDVTATGLLALVRDNFNAGTDRSGSSIGEPTDFFVGAAASPNADDLEREVRLVHKKVEAGAGFLLSQPVYEVAALERFKALYAEMYGEQMTVPLIAGVLPLATAQHAEFLHNEVPGIVIPEEVRERLRRAGDAGWREGLAIAAELTVAFKESGAAGIYVMPQFGRYDRAAEVVEVARAAAKG